jgi:serine/threonine-protein phosphatase 2B catalytic subunit
MSRPKPEPGQRPQPLKDPCNDRPLKDLPPPPAQLLTLDVVFDKSGQPDLETLMSHFKLEGALDQELLLTIIKKASEIFEQEPNLLKLSDPITVVGDIHGQYFDLEKLFEIGGMPGDTQYIFLGDYVDRGSFSVEVVATLFTIKIKYPKRVRMLRGNHECRQMTSFFNFREECEHKYDIGVYNAIMDAFDTLPIAATINGKFLCVHGGLSPDFPTLKAINGVNRFQEPPREGLLCDIIWADPLESLEAKDGVKPKKGGSPFIANEVRGCSYYFSFEGAVKFLQKNQLLSVIRAHEAQLEGYKMHKTNPATGFPSVITIFSAPNYCDCYNNKAAILKFDNSTLNILQFNCSPHPYHLPNFMDVFTWSMPFVIEKVTEMLYYIIQPAAGKQSVEDIKLPDLPGNIKSHYRASLSEEGNKAVELSLRLGQMGNAKSDGKDGSSGPPEEDARDRMRKKVRSIARMARMFKTLRQENEAIIRLKGMCPGHKLAPGLLLAGKERLQNELEVFSHMSQIDTENELRPDGNRNSLPISRDFINDDDADAAASSSKDGEGKSLGSATEGR